MKTKEELNEESLRGRHLKTPLLHTAADKVVSHYLDSKKPSKQVMKSYEIIAGIFYYHKQRHSAK